MAIKNILFDFDGVLVESVQVKTQAFRKMYQKYGEDIQNKVESYHLENGGMSRYEKIKYYHEQLLGIKTNDELIKILTNEFSNIVKNQVIKSKYVDGAYKFINTNKYYKCWVITGTPENEIKSIIKYRDIDKYFVGIHGSPKTKDQIIKEVVKNNKLKINETIYIGDAITDYDAAKKNNILFVLRETDYNNIIFSNIKCIKINNLNNLNSIIENINV